MSVVLSAHPAVVGSVAHEPPRLSASAGERHMACSSSLAREWEYYMWAASHGIRGLASGPEANRGVILHKLAALIPFAGREHGEEPFNIRDRVESEAKTQGVIINSYDAWLCTRFVERRNEFVEWIIDQHPGGRSAVDQIDLLLDNTRLGKDFTGTPDVVVVAAGRGKVIAGVVDYKSGQGQHKDASENTQLSILAALVSAYEGELGIPSTVYTVILTEPEISEPLQIGKFEEPALAAVKDRMKKAESRALPLVDLVLQVASDPSKEWPKSLDATLDLNASIGSHCFRCKGKVCCGAIKVAAAEGIRKMYSIVEYAQHHPINPAMDPKKLSESIAISASMEGLEKIISAYREEAENLALQLNGKGVALEGVKIVEGSKRISLEETGAKALHATLGPVLEMSTGETLTFEQFAAGIVESSKVSATGLRSFIAGRLGIPETKVVEQLSARMSAIGKPSPLIQKPTSPSVTTTLDVSDVIEHLAHQTKMQISEFSKREAQAPTPALDGGGKLAAELNAALAGIKAGVVPAVPKTPFRAASKAKSAPAVVPFPDVEEQEKPQGVALWG